MLERPITDRVGNGCGHVNWLRFCWCCRRNSILADEMGLGKTAQLVSILNNIALRYAVTDPFLVLSPLSTLPHWHAEFENWTSLNVVVYHGSPAARHIIYEYEFPAVGDDGKKLPRRVGFNVVVTNYETFVTDFVKFENIEWRYLVLDEGHRLKNHTGKCYQLLQHLRYEHCTLLTGTAIQNTVEELWSLLLLLLQIFNNLPDFLARFGAIDNIDTLAKLQDLIKPFLLRRKKGDVEQSIAAKEETIIEVELTRIQKTYYRALLHENTSTLLQHITGGSLPSLLNLMMQLRKVCNHPSLIKGATQNIEVQIAAKFGETATQEEVELRAIIDSSGKMIFFG
jgi:SNF2 family DNA or RNA helicase